MTQTIALTRLGRAYLPELRYALLTRRAHGCKPMRMHDTYDPSADRNADQRVAKNISIRIRHLELIREFMRRKDIKSLSAAVVVAVKMALEQTNPGDPK